MENSQRYDECWDRGIYWIGKTVHVDVIFIRLEQTLQFNRHHSKKLVCLHLPQ